MSNEKIKKVEEPLLEINIKVDRTINGKYDNRLNWSGGFYRKDIGYKVIE